ncbi:MAG: phosphoglycerate mutase [Sedimentibacter sp.]
MKTILIILDGASEDKIFELGNKTPLEYACTPVLDKIVIRGEHKNTTFYPTDKKPDSLNCILTILGVNEKLIPPNRAYLEALAADIRIEEFEAALRCNLVSIKNGRLLSFNGMGLAKSEMESAALNVKIFEGMKFYNISGYRNILAVNKNKINFKLNDMPPHENMGETVDAMLENIRSINILYEFTKDNIFKVNNEEYMFYPWGISESVKLPTFKELHNKTCSCICNAEIVKGIAKTMKMNVPLLKNSTGDVDTDLREKAETALSELKSHDVVIVHINGTDEASHRRNLSEKIKFIERIDKEFLAHIYEEAKYNAKIIIVADHQTSSITGKHAKGPVDFIVSN